MSQGLRPHFHQYYEHRVDSYFDNQKGCMVKEISYRCMICGRIRHEKYDCYIPPPKPKDKSKVLERNKRRYRE